MEKTDTGSSRAIAMRRRWPAAVVAIVLMTTGAVVADDATSFDHGEWSRMLARHVAADGRVAYRNWKQQDEQALEAYLDRLAAADPEKLPRDERLAFWINAYNAMAVAGVLDGYDAENLFARYRFFKSYEREIAGEERTLEEIEHEIIRKRFDEFRIHFAVNCASLSCPVLRSEAYVGDRLDAQLDEQARRFLADPWRNRFDAAADAVYLSKIFEWFEEDFVTDERTLVQALAPHLAESQRQLLEAKPVRYLDYDWTLNALDDQRP